MSIFENLHAERQMSLNHWRYRLLHWSLGRDNPQYLYTHYCPLFHLTNLLLIFFPVVLVVKIVVYLIKAVHKGISYLAMLIPKKERIYTAEDILECMRSFYKNGYDFTKFYNSFGWEKLKLNYPESMCDHQYLSNLWNTNLLQWEELKQVREAARKVRREKIAVYANFSSLLIKGLLNTAYVILAFTLGYIGVTYVAPQLFYATVYCWNFLFTLNPIATILDIMWFIMATIVLTAGIVLIKKLSVPAIPGLKIFWDGVLSFFNYIKTLVENSAEFVKMFYEENCPPIKIIDEDK